MSQLSPALPDRSVLGLSGFEAMVGSVAIRAPAETRVGGSTQGAGAHVKPPGSADASGACACASVAANRATAKAAQVVGFFVVASLAPRLGSVPFATAAGRRRLGGRVRRRPPPSWFPYRPGR